MSVRETRERVLLGAAVASWLDGGETEEDLPDSCDGCGHCCGRMLVTDRRDNERMARYARRHHAKPTVPNIGGYNGTNEMCAWLDPDTNRCRVYAARPRVCRCWESPKHANDLIGTKPGQPCGMSATLARVALVGHGQMGDYDTWTGEWQEVHE